MSDDCRVHHELNVQSIDFDPFAGQGFEGVDRAKVWLDQLGLSKAFKFEVTRSEVDPDILVFRACWAAKVRAS